ncbi:PAS domain S-box protein [Sinorhizobium medicae]|uniref:histidine kinase n=2 Tax=Sinorhizobium medicae TaxID=110321 RepID=A0A6G1WG56_9HYPH|nr:histidine kinase dimerization/phosphoacceptor domain -containing protein [Sinorhizobium medicae]ABR64589.1 signal transduction histidine kinase [Sinorhizobium medicae WSM419]MBO1944909.1 ATP-binding protein [Sinorhizobium medicae]MDX0413730.1 PAS domain S-box protein [Sinorhizobium medicae]MDX0426114.1 PAS domain S-box protein [Sinorhizobium medicae]MDX0436516.1 PAS domain S-box protein [Sinorhizobium medicae]
MTSDNVPEQVDRLLGNSDLVEALENKQFKRFLDQVPIALVISRIGSGGERIIYANPEFERLSGLAVAEVENQEWAVLEAVPAAAQEGASLGQAVTAGTDRIGTYKRNAGDSTALLDVYSNVVEDDEGTPCFRLVALVDVTEHKQTEREELESRIKEQDLLLRELQHRVKNNLQMITALIRLEARGNPPPDTRSFERLAGRVEALTTLYDAMANGDSSQEVDLGTYIGQIAAAVMASNACDGVSLDMKIDPYPVSVNVAMPTGLVVNELLTNALKHAFNGREGGVITLRSTFEDDGYRVIVADDGIGFPDGETWPKHGKLGELIAQSLRENSRADLQVISTPGQGTRATIRFRNDSV